LWILFFSAEPEHPREKCKEGKETDEIGKERTPEFEKGPNGKDSTSECHEQHQHRKGTLLMPCGIQSLGVRVYHLIEYVHAALAGCFAGYTILKLCKAVCAKSLAT
jgi:hypothetical protein